MGINEYPPLAKQEALKGAVADACDFADWVLDPTGGNVPPECLFFWTYPWPVAPQGRLHSYLEGGPPDAQQSFPPKWWSNVDSGLAAPNKQRAPSALEITTTIEDLGRVLRGQALDRADKETRRVYVFLAGHGIRAKTVDRSEETCFLAGDFRPAAGNLVAGLVPCDSFRRALLNDRFSEAILFTDCCRKQTARSSLVAQVVSDYSGQPTEPHSIAYAAQDDDLAHETTTTPVRGAFSSALMRGLRTHRASAANELYAAPLKQYVLDNIKDFTDSGQTPTMWFHPDGNGPLIVVGVPAITGLALTSRTIDVSALPHGTQLTLNGGGNTALAGVPPFLVAGPTIETPPLSPGLYSIDINDSSGRYAIFKHPSAEAVRVG